MATKVNIYTQTVAHLDGGITTFAQHPFFLSSSVAEA